MTNRNYDQLMYPKYYDLSPLWPEPGCEKMTSFFPSTAQRHWIRRVAAASFVVASFCFLENRRLS
jgi:hypothetical protein